MAKPNYKFDKRQRDLAKKKQQDEKRMKKLAKAPKPGDATTSDAPSPPSSNTVTRE